MANLKITCLGGGSLYFCRALGDLVLETDLTGAEIVLYDIDPEKAARMAAMGRRLAAAAGRAVAVRAADGLEDAVDGAAFALSSLGGSGAEITPTVYGSFYHSADMHIPARYGVHQVIGDTCGPAGMMMALRAIPAYLAICRELERRAPRVVLLNHSNPMAPLCRAMNQYTSVNTIGICHGVQATVRRAAELLDVPPAALQCSWIGTNHYYWLTEVRQGGVDRQADLMAHIRTQVTGGKASVQLLLSDLYGFCVGYPGASHLLEFYPFLAQARSQDDLPYDMATEARQFGFDERVPMPAGPADTPADRAAFMARFQHLLDGTQLPVPDRHDWTAAEGIGGLIAAITTGRREIVVVNIPNRGLVPNLPPEALLEVEGVTDASGVKGIQSAPCPPVLKGILEKRVAWQELVATAGATGDRALARQALVLDEMAVRPELAGPMLEELLAASRPLLPQFFT
jgi:alpha-galactosidase